MDWINLISEVGFPILITLYLLHRMEAKIDQLTQSIKDLAVSLK
ncbi:YvrJ family protein [Bacillus sp. FJAT-52991]|uniref:YvrJ family protein n=1 Tax=Bacillus kandeliae TaxID=3129297 RepID=A0ABZ2NCR9_9BACI